MSSDEKSDCKDKVEQLTADTEIKKVISDKFIEFTRSSKCSEDMNLLYDVDLTATEGESSRTQTCDAYTESPQQGVDGNKISRWPTGYKTQVSALCKRAFIQARKDILDKLGFIQYICISLICGLLWFDTPYDEESLIDRNGVIFFVLVYLTMNPMFFALMTFPAERNAIAKERAAGMYRLSAYYTAKSVSELPVLLLMPLMLYTITYWMTGLNRSPVFLIGCLQIITTSILAQSIGLCLGGGIKDFKRSITCTIVLALGSMLLAGFYTRRIPSWLTWAKYLSHITYGYNILVRLEFQYAVKTFTCATESAFEVCSRNNTVLHGSDILERVTTIDLSVGESFVVLWCYTLACRILFYFILKYTNKAS